MDDYSFPEMIRDFFNEVPVYHSGESENEDEKKDFQIKVKKERTWIVFKDFSSPEEAENFIKSEDTWSRNYSRTTEDGKKVYYRCNKVKKIGPQCDAEIYILYVSYGDNVVVYKTDKEHNHDDIGTRQTYGIQKITKLEIDKLFELRLKPKAILEALGKIEGLKLPSKKQLYNYLSDRKTSVFGKCAISLGELEQWIHDHTDIPEDDNEVFVISYYIFEGIEPYFRFALSTKRLLGIIPYTDILHADATYKLIWQGFPVLIVGTTDKNRKFHPLCLGVASNERQEDFQVMFEGLKEKTLQIHEYIMRPRVLVCDGAHAIQNAFTVVFGVEPTIRMCWAHAKKNMRKKVEKMVTKSEQKRILLDIDALHDASSSEIFYAASQSFLLKWKDENIFLKYFKEEWLQKNRNWFLGAASMSPSTNNALEAFNRSIKDHNTLRERLPLPRFLNVGIAMVVQWSEQACTLPEMKTIELKEWTEAYIWAKKNIKINIIRPDSINKVYLIRNENTDPTVSFHDRWVTFDEYKTLKKTFNKTILPISDWKKGTCNCPQFLKRYMCKHVLGLAIRLKLAIPPMAAKALPLGQKRKRGRPTKSRPALVLQ